MKKLILILLAAASFASCTKNNTVPPPEVVKNLMKEIYVWDNGVPETSNYTYDAQGRLTEDKDDSWTESFNYVSASTLVVTTRKTSDNSLENTKECELNASGYITKVILKNPGGAVTYTYEFTYNAEGYLTKFNAFTPGGSGYGREYTYVNGNPVSVKIYSNGVQTGTGEYIFDNTKSNKTPWGVGGLWPSYKLFGKRYKNLVSEYKQFNMSNTLTYHSQNVFELDAQGYPTKTTTTDVLLGKQGVSTSTYQ
ncbi:MAG TPA: DUF4595 domain-containing protein [Chitinophagaceae bacterium]|nr:DUF4595 domain-containing protein [Chitinophagaceae bacterium]